MNSETPTHTVTVTRPDGSTISAGRGSPLVVMAGGVRWS